MVPGSPTFSEAKSYSGLKQIYLDCVMQSCPESVQGLIYDPGWSNRIAYEDRLIAEGHIDKSEFEKEREKDRPEVKNAYFLVIFSPSLLGLGRRHPIFVSDKGFDKMKSEAHFLSCVLDHESFHTDSLTYGMRLPNGILIDHCNIDQLSQETVRNFREVIAYRNQLHKLTERGIDDSVFEGWLQRQTVAYRYALYSINPKSDLEKQVLRCK